MRWFAPESNQSKFSYFYGRLDNFSCEITNMQNNMQSSISNYVLLDNNMCFILYPTFICTLNLITVIMIITLFPCFRRIIQKVTNLVIILQELSLMTLDGSGWSECHMRGFGAWHSWAHQFRYERTISGAVRRISHNLLLL